MHRYQVLIEYVGTRFIGWQIQKKGKSIQKIIQSKISKLLKEKVSLIGSGRTDSGVHAIEQSAHFDCKKKIENLKRFIKSLNFFLNEDDISIKLVKKRSLLFHARFSAKERIYKYIILNQISPSVLNHERGWHITKKLDVKSMQKGGKKLLGSKDFSTFRASSCNAKSPIRTMKKVIIRSKNNKIIFEFRSQSFLQQQVRSMVGCLKYLGEQKWDIKKFDKILKSRKRALCAPPAPSMGLFLEKVKY